MESWQLDSQQGTDLFCLISYLHWVNYLNRVQYKHWALKRRKKTPQNINTYILWSHYLNRLVFSLSFTFHCTVLFKNVLMPPSSGALNDNTHESKVAVEHQKPCTQMHKTTPSSQYFLVAVNQAVLCATCLSRCVDQPSEKWGLLPKARDLLLHLHAKSVRGMLHWIYFYATTRQRSHSIWD